MNKRISWLCIILCAFVFFNVAQVKADSDIYISPGTINLPTTSNKVIIDAEKYVYTGSPSIGSDAAGGYMKNRSDSCSVTVRGYCGISLVGGIAAVLGVRHNGVARWGTPSQLGFLAKNDVIVIQILTSEAGEKLKDIQGSWKFPDFQLGAIYDINNNNIVSNIYLTSLTLVITKETCAVTTSHDMAFYWTDLTPNEISNGNAQIKNAPISLSCNNSNVGPLQVTITSSQGANSVANGVINTDLLNLGIKLTWASNGLPVALETPIDFPAATSSTEDLSINAQPVQTGSGTVGAGDFSTAVTMNIEYR